MAEGVTRTGAPWPVVLLVAVALAAALAVVVWVLRTPTPITPIVPRPPQPAPPTPQAERPPRPRYLIDESGWTEAINQVRPWSDPTSLFMVRDAWDRVGYRGIGIMDHHLVHD